MSILDVIRHKSAEHSRRARAEGRGFEAEFLALLTEIIEMNFNDVQGKANALLDKLSQLEADVKDLVAKSGGTVSQTPTNGNVVSDDQLNSFVAVLDNIGTRIDALKDEVVHGTAKPEDTSPTSSAPVTTSSTSASTTPSSASPPASAPPSTPPSATPVP